MLNKWEQRGTATNAVDAVLYLSGLNENELCYPASTAPSGIENLVIASEMIENAIDSETPITVVGDYDADGVCSSAILFLLLKERGCANPTIKIPKRLSQGYGINTQIIDEISEGLVITVDNGIMAHDAIAKAKSKGLQVVVIDHHLPGDSLPNADVIVDPHINPEKNGYEDYCGAGLAYKFAQQMIPYAHSLLEKMLSLAAIATIADVMPLTGDNRIIVRDGLKALNSGKVTQGLNSLLQACDFMVIKEDDIGYKVAPILNAIGRLQDNGAMYACGCIAQDDKPMDSLAAKLLDVNQQRKKMVEKEMLNVEKRIKEFGVKAPIIYLDADLHEGIAGILAGKITDKYKVPAFVLTGKDGKIKGSGRSAGDIHLKDLMDAYLDSSIVQYGGHAGAVGLSLPTKELPYFARMMDEALSDFTPAEDIDVIYYDAQINADEVVRSINELDNYGPYGEGVPRPIFMVKGIELAQKKGEYFILRGAAKNHISMSALGYSMIGFNLANKYQELDCPTKIDVVGELEMNVSKYGTVPQIRITDLRAAQ